MVIDLGELGPAGPIFYTHTIDFPSLTLEVFKELLSELNSMKLEDQIDSLRIVCIKLCIQCHEMPRIS